MISHLPVKRIETAEIHSQKSAPRRSPRVSSGSYGIWCLRATSSQCRDGRILPGVQDSELHAQAVRRRVVFTGFRPVLSEVRASGDQRALRDLVDHVAGTLAAILLAITAIGVLAAPLVLAIFAPGWLIDSRPEFWLSADMLRITFPYILLISLTALAGGILNTFDRFLVPALTPVLLNVSLIAAAVLLSVRMEVPVMALAWGVLAAGIAQLLIQGAGAGQAGSAASATLGLAPFGRPQDPQTDDPDADWLLGRPGQSDVGYRHRHLPGERQRSWLYYSDRLLEFPLGVFGVALSTVILPNLSRKFARQNPRAFSATLDWALRLAFIITLPAALGLALLASPILITLFQYQAFQMSDVEMAALSLAAYAAGLPAFIAVKVLAPGFYARQDTKTPVKIAITAMVSNMVLNFPSSARCWHWISRGHIPGWPWPALSLPTSMQVCFTGCCASRMPIARKAVGGQVILSVVLACSAMVAALLWQFGELAQWADASAWVRATRLGLLILWGVVVYAIVLAAGGLRRRHLEKGAS